LYCYTYLYIYRTSLFLHIQLSLIHWIISLSIKLFSFFSIFKNCLCIEFLLQFVCIQRVFTHQIISNTLFFCWSASFNFKRSSVNLLSLLIIVCHSAFTVFIKICCFSLFCCWSLSVVKSIAEFLCLFCDLSVLIM